MDCHSLTIASAANTEINDWLKLLVPAAVAISVFVFGVLVAWLKANTERRRDTRHLRATVITWVSQIGASVQTLGASCRDFASRATATHEIHPEQFKFNSLHASKVSGIELTKTIKAFVTNSNGDDALKNENYYKLISGLEFLTDVEDEIKKKYKEHYNYSLKLLDTWNKNFIAFDNAHLKLITTVRDRDESRKQIEGDLNKLIVNWLDANRKNGQNIDYTYEALLAPYEDLITKYLRDTTAKEEEVSGLLSALQDLVITYRQWAAAKEAYGLVFTEYSAKIDKAYQQTLASATFFHNSTKIKLFCN